MSDSEKMREFAEFLDSSGWQGFGEYIALCRRVASEIERLRCLLTPCRHDTDIEDVGYPRTANDVLSLLSAYIADVIPSESIPDDEYFGAWERLARPVIEAIVMKTDRLRAENEWLRSLIQPQVLAAAVKALGEELKQESEVNDAH